MSHPLFLSQTNSREMDKHEAAGNGPMPIWYVSAIGGRLTCYTAILASEVIFNSGEIGLKD